MKVGQVSINREKARKLWKEYNVALKTRSKDYKREVDIIKKCYYQLSKGRPIIDIQDVFKKTGFNDKFFPLLAFAPAKAKTAYFYQSPDMASRGSGRFQDTSSTWSYKLFLSINENIFKPMNRNNSCMVKANVPLIPPKFLPRSIKNHYLLWEVDDWEEMKPKRDPILLKKISGSLYCVVGSWNLTKIETLITKGRL
jgi:hypothetical protein